MCMNILVRVPRMAVCMCGAVGDVGVGWFRVICGIYVASKTGLGGGEIDVNSEERSQACGQTLSA